MSSNICSARVAEQLGLIHKAPDTVVLLLRAASVPVCALLLPPVEWRRTRLRKLIGHLKLPSRPACRPVFVTSLSQCLLSGSGCSCQVAMGLCHCVLVVTEATGCIGRRVAVDRERSLEFAYGCVWLEVLLSSTTFLAGHAPQRLVFDKLPCQRSGICLHSLCGSLGLVSPRVCLYRNVLWEFHGWPARPLTEPSVCDVCVLWWLLPLCSTLKG